MPVLVDLPDEGLVEKPTTWSRVRSRIARVNWQRWQKLALHILAFLLDSLRKLFVRIARGSERLVKTLRARLTNLSGSSGASLKTAPFFMRVRKRSAFVEEERRLIEQLTANPKDVDAYRRLGNLYVIAGNVADAKAAFSEVVRLVPGDEEAQRRLFELSEQQINGKQNLPG